MSAFFSSVGVVIYVSIASCLPQSGSSDSYTSDTKMQESAMRVTNSFRSQHGAAPVTWNSSLADIATTWASRCVWEHSMGALGVTGENLAFGYPDMKAAIDVWGNERDLYDFKAPTGVIHETGHFTQLVWKDTTSMGCAAVDCNNKGGMSGYFVVCEYYPQGNIVSGDLGYFRANVQPQGGYIAPAPVQAPSSAPPAVPVAETVATPSAVSTIPPPPVAPSFEAKSIPPPPPSTTVQPPPPQSETPASVPTSTDQRVEAFSLSSSSLSTSIESLSSSSLSSSTPTPEPTSETVAPVSSSTETSSAATETTDLPLLSSSEPISTETIEASSTVEPTTTSSIAETSLLADTSAFSMPSFETSTTVVTSASEMPSETASETPFQSPWVPNSAAIKTAALPLWAAGLVSLMAVLFV